jgi:hypothetical protein
MDYYDKKRRGFLMKKTWFAFMALLIVSTLFIPAQSSAEMQMESLIRLVHASPDAPAVDIYMNDEQIVSEAVFADATNYFSVPEGTNSIQVYAAGTKGKQAPVLSTTVNLQGGMAYTAVAANTLQNLELTVLEDEMGVTNGKAKIRVSHFSPDAPPVNIGLKSGDVLFNKLTFKQTTNYEELEPNTYDLAVTTADGSELVLDLSETELAENTIYHILAINTANQLEALMLEDQPMIPSEMPKTGMGGMASGYWLPNLLYTSAGIVTTGLLLLAVRRYRA